MSHRDMSDMTRIAFLRNEIVVPDIVYEAASRIFSAHIANDKVNDDNEVKIMEIAVSQALELAITTERLISTSSSAQLDQSHLVDSKKPL